jgi:hypothetical protein
METGMTWFRLPEGVLRASLEGEEVLLNQDTGVYHLVNVTGRSLIRSFEGGDSLEDAIRSLATATGESEERVAADASAFVEAMVERGLLEAVVEPS